LVITSAETVMVVAVTPRQEQALEKRASTPGAEEQAVDAQEGIVGLLVFGSSLRFWAGGGMKVKLVRDVVAVAICWFLSV
jgi:hypothetical protein